MGYVMPARAAENTSKAIISLWFRVPASSIAAAAAEYNALSESGGDRPPFTGIIPLIVFGPAGEFEGSDIEVNSFGSFHAQNMHWSDGFGAPDCIGAGWRETEGEEESGVLTATAPVLNGKFTPRDPSFIGVDCTTGTGILSVHLRMPKDVKATYGGSFPKVVGLSIDGNPGFWAGGGPCGNFIFTGPTDHCPIDHLAVFHTWSMSTIATASSADVVLGGYGEIFRTLPTIGTEGQIDNPDPDFRGQEVTPDHWHHLLLSFDFSSSISASGTMNDFSGARKKGSGSGAKLYIAFDDKNLTGTELSAYTVGPNSILTVNGYYVYEDNTMTATDFSEDCVGNGSTFSITESLPTYSLSGGNLEITNLGLPASSEFSKAIKQVEMGEFQMFTDISRDTNDIQFRRAFVDKDGKPTSMGKAKKLLGKEPEYKLHGVSNWKKAKSTGSRNSEPRLEGTAVGKIERYKPDPSLHGDQGEQTPETPDEGGETP